jgi:hypothetical protein
MLYTIHPGFLNNEAIIDGKKIKSQISSLLEVKDPG